MDFDKFQKEFRKVAITQFASQVNSSPIVSVCVQTYNHAPYIQKCLEGILMQDTTFNIEIRLGEDDSTDGTREVCIDYANRFPDKIRLFLHRRENNILIDGHPTGRFNFIHNLLSSKAKYIAICDGDDFWTDPFKLQKQIDFLETNPEFELVYHPCQVLEKDGQLVKDYIAGQKFNRENSNIYDLATFGNFMHTSSVVFRHGLVELPPQFMQAPIGDFFLYMLLAQHGLFKRLSNEMAVYRNQVGIYSPIKSKKKRLAWKQTVELIARSMQDETVKKILRLRLGPDSESFKNWKSTGSKQMASQFSFNEILQLLRAKLLSWF